MAENSRASIAIHIAIPLVTFLGGMATQYLIARQTLAYQEFSTAMNIATNDVAQRNEDLKLWANDVIAQYVRDRRQQQSNTADLPKDVLFVSRKIADEVCLFPKEAFREPVAGKYVANVALSEPEKLVGRNANGLFIDAIKDFQTMRNEYNAVIRVLKGSCGFLLK